MLRNNCEHFCEWCLRDEHRSYQVERLLKLPRRAVRVCAFVIARLRPENNHALGRPIPVLRPPKPQHVTFGRHSPIAGHCRSRSLSQPAEAVVFMLVPCRRRIGG
jgi:hypothetical protein